MVKFWALRIEMNLERVEEVPAKLRDQVREYIEQNK